MRRPSLLEDTITRRLAITVTLAAGVTLLVLQLFFTFGGQWAKPDIQETGLLALQLYFDVISDSLSCDGTGYDDRRSVC